METAEQIDALKVRVDALMPFLPSEFEPEHHADFPALAAAGRVGEALIQNVYATGNFVGDATLDLLTAEVPDAATSLLLDDLRAVSRDAAPVSREAVVLTGLLGPNVVFEAANEAWQHGYRLCLARLDLENRHSGRQRPHRWRTERSQTIVDIVRSLPRDPSEWVAVNACDPFDAPAILDACRFLAVQTMKKVAPFVPTAGQEVAQARVNRLVLTGYAIGRAQQEADVVELLSEKQSTPASSAASTVDATDRAHGAKASWTELTDTERDLLAEFLLAVNNEVAFTDGRMTAKQANLDPIFQRILATSRGTLDRQVLFHLHENYDRLGVRLAERGRLSPQGLFDYPYASNRVSQVATLLGRIDGAEAGRYVKAVWYLAVKTAEADHGVFGPKVSDAELATVNHIVEGLTEPLGLRLADVLRRE